MKDHLLHLVRYTQWADRQIIDALEALEEETTPARGLELLSHLLRAQQVWLARIQGEGPMPPIWGEESLAQCRTRADASAKAWLNFLDTCEESSFSETIYYENSRGHTYTNELHEIVAHVVNHSTHHRAQIAARIREAGATPPATDYIFWARSG